MDNIDVDYARNKGIAVVNTPAASSLSVAELVFAHLFTGVRFLYDANRKMPLEGGTRFNDLKKAYAKGIELRGKTIGIIGFGRIGRETAKIALGLGMDVLAYDLNEVPKTLSLELSGNITVDVSVKGVSLNELFSQSDFISLHVPFADKPVIGQAEFDLMKNGVGLVNCSRGGTVDEQALIKALDSGKLAFAGLDVFENEPQPLQALLSHSKVSLTPHIGASTNEAQERIGAELANLIIDYFKK
jgi:D-3-phosphoglycerate dehydrogenase